MWQTKRSPLNALTHTLTFPVNLEGRQGGHLCCGGRARAAETVFIITPPPLQKKPCQKPSAVWPPAAACGRENNNKQWKIRESGGVERSRAPFFFVRLSCLLCIILNSVCQQSSGFLWSQRGDFRNAGKAIRSPGTRPVGKEKKKRKNSCSTCLQSWFD